MRYPLLTSVFALVAGAAAAQDAALILGTDRYERLGRVSRGADVVMAQEALTDLGFDVQSLRNGRAQATAQVLDDFAKAAVGADRLVVILSGRFATDGRLNWYLGAESDVSLSLTIPQAAVSVEGILNILASAPGTSVLLVGVEDQQGDALGDWVTEGLADIAVPQGVTLITGAPAEIAAFAMSDLTEPAADLGVALADWSDLTVKGFAPDHWVLMPDKVDVAQDTPPPAAVDPAAEDSLWQGAVALDTIDAFRNYLNRYPDGRYSAEAEKVIAEIIAEPNRMARKAEEALGLTREQRREIQRALTILDYNTRGIDGIFGPGSRRAIANWQQVNGYGQTTYLTTEQISRLDAQASRRAAELEAEAERKRREEARLDRAYWDETGARGDEPGYRAYLGKYPDGIFSQLAQERLSAIEDQKRAAAEAEDRAAWDSARAGNTIAAYQTYLRAYPDGVFKADAEAQITALTQADSDQADLDAARAQEAALGLNPITARLVEARLQQLGLEPGVVDGRFDDDTRRALRRYQRARDLPVTGYLNEPTVVRLLADSVGVVGR